MRSERTGGPCRSRRPTSTSTTPNLYGWLLDHRADLAGAVGDDRWLALGIEHTRFYQPGERPRTSVKAPDEEEVIEDAVMTRVPPAAPIQSAAPGCAGSRIARRRLAASWNSMAG